MSDSTCKICNGKITAICKCPRVDHHCENGHSYHWSSFHNEWHVGVSNHKIDTFGEDCCEEKKTL